MARRRPRIVVTKDPELASALKATRPPLDPSDTRSQARHLRRLALAGAQALVNDTGSPRAAQKPQLIPEHPGVRPATRDLLSLPWIREPAGISRAKRRMALAASGRRHRSVADPAGRPKAGRT
jgi:hypothetical protein